MISTLDALDGRARLFAAGLVALAFAAVILGPVLFGASALISAYGINAEARSAQVLLADRIGEYDDRRARFEVEQNLSPAQLDSFYLNGATAQARFSEELAALSQALRDQGVAVREPQLRTRALPEGVTRMEADLSVTGSLTAILGVLSAPAFAELRAENVSFASEASAGDVRGALRLVRLHAGVIEQENDDAG